MDCRYEKTPGAFRLDRGPHILSWMRLRATLPHSVVRSTIAVPGLLFRVLSGTGRLPLRTASRPSLFYWQSLDWERAVGGVARETVQIMLHSIQSP